MSLAFYIMLFVFALLTIMRLPIALSMIASSILYLAMMQQDLGLVVDQSMSGLFESFVLLAVPLFILAANFMNVPAVSQRLLNFCLALVGSFKGGLAHVNVLISLVFAGMSGSAIADAAGFGKVIIDLMRKENRYPPGFAAAITAASSTIGPIIPPSIPMVLYALISGSSVGYLFLGGILPGIFMAIMLMIMNAIIAHYRGFKREEKIALKEFPKITFQAFPVLLLPVILLWGIYGGATTPTEASSIAALYALILATLFYRSLSLKQFYTNLVDSAKATASVGLIIVASLVFNYVVANEYIAPSLAAFVEGLNLSPAAFLLLINVLFLLLGCVFDATTLLLVFVPLFIPALKVLDIDLVHFGVVIVINIMLGLITPPYGVVLFVINGATGIPLKDIIREVLPFIGVLLIALLTLTYIPEITLWLPKQFGYMPLP
ncbi:MAG: TRAP transporter large permease [Alphaproteobacteria bacterium]